MANDITVKHGWILLSFIPLYITKRSEAVLQWGEQKKYQKEGIENRNYGGIIEKRTQHLVI